MAETSAISWTHATFNGWAGCTKVSPACDNCYAERDTLRRGYLKAWGPNAPRRITRTWGEPGRWDREVELEGVDRRVFAFSWADWLDKEVAPELLAQFLSLIAATPHLTWLLLTKRIARWDSAMRTVAGLPAGASLAPGVQLARLWVQGKAPHNVWMGVTAENQTYLDARAPFLMRIPAVVRFLSCEPLLGPLDLSPWVAAKAMCSGCGYRTADRRAVTSCKGYCQDNTGKSCDAWPCPRCERLHYWTCGFPRIDWVIVGGESGAGWRPMDLDNVRAIRDMCVRSGVPFHFKQHAAFAPKSLGRELDGRTWDEVPHVNKHALGQLRQAAILRVEP